MSAPLSRQLFHGTIETLKPGDVIKPRASYAPAWATTNLRAAIEHTKDRTVTGLGKEPDQWPVHHGNIYEVEPLHEDDPTLTGQTMAATPGAVASNLGFRVKGQVASVLGEAYQHQDIRDNFPDFDPSKEAYVKEGRERAERMRRGY